MQHHHHYTIIQLNWQFFVLIIRSFITTMTVGYGDLSLEKDSSRAFSIFYILFSVILVAAAIGNFGAIQAEIKAENDR